MRSLGLPLCAALLVISPSSSAPRKWSFDDAAIWRIGWEAIFEQEEDCYWVLVYHPLCPYSQSVVQASIDYADKGRLPKLYFYEADGMTPRGNALWKTIGVSSADDFFVIGWPSLVSLSERSVTDQIVGAQAVHKALGR